MPSSTPLQTIVQQAASQPQAARAALHAHLAAHPDDPNGWRLAAQWATSPEQAAQHWEKVLALCPDDLPAKQGLVAARYPGHTFDPQHGIVPTGSLTMPAQRRPAWQVMRVAAASLLAVTLAGLGLTWAQSQPPATAPAPVVARLDAPAQPAPTALPLEQQALLEALTSLARLAIASEANNAPVAPGPAITVDLEQGRAFRQTLRQAVPATGGVGQVLVTEAQLTGWLALELRHTPELPVRDPQVYLLNERIHVFATLTDGTRTTTALVVGGAHLTAEGGVVLFIDSAQFGGLTVPQPLIDQGTAWLNTRLAQEIDRQTPGLRLTNLQWMLRAVQLTGQR